MSIIVQEEVYICIYIYVRILFALRNLLGSRPAFI